MREKSKSRRNDLAKVTSKSVSMTGFGKSVVDNPSLALEVEVKSVNHRYLDCSLKLPRIYSQFEQEIRSLVGTKIGRGRVEVFVQRQAKEKEAYKLGFNEALFSAYYKLAADQCAEHGKLSTETTHRIVLDILSRREVLEIMESDGSLETERKLLLDGVREALDNLVTMKRIEGDKIGEDIRGRIRQVAALQEQISKLAVAAPKELKKKLSERVSKLAPEVKVDAERIAAEVVMAADRVDVTEELVRLSSHIKQFQATLAEPACGRKLDFILQEVGRELNTIASKAQQAKIQSMVVEAKAEIEKIKEQVQNVE